MPLDKRSIMLAALDQHMSVTGEVHVGVLLGVPGLVLPESFTRGSDGYVFLKYSYRYRPPPGIDSDGIRATLTSGGVSYETFVPWGAVFTLREDATGTVVYWPHLASEPDAGEETKEDTAEGKKKKKNHLQLV